MLKRLLIMGVMMLSLQVSSVALADERDTVKAHICSDEELSEDGWIQIANIRLTSRPVWAPQGFVNYFSNYKYEWDFEEGYLDSDRWGVDKVKLAVNEEKDGEIEGVTVEYRHPNGTVFRKSLSLDKPFRFFGKDIQKRKNRPSAPKTQVHPYGAGIIIPFAGSALESLVRFPRLIQGINITGSTLGEYDLARVKVHVFVPKRIEQKDEL